MQPTDTLDAAQLAEGDAPHSDAQLLPGAEGAAGSVAASAEPELPLPADSTGEDKPTPEGAPAEDQPQPLTPEQEAAIQRTLGLQLAAQQAITRLSTASVKDAERTGSIDPLHLQVNVNVLIARSLALAELLLMCGVHIDAMNEVLAKHCNAFAATLEKPKIEVAASVPSGIIKSN